MSQIKKFAISFIFALIIGMAFHQVQAASDFDLKKLDFNATLNTDGSMNVTETWQVKINGETNTLFKTFEKDSSKYSGITNVSVAEIQNGSKRTFSQSFQWKNHVSTNYFHALTYQGKFEIAWGVNKSSGTHTYVVNYTVKDAVKVYADCAELYWQFIGEDFEVPVDNVTGKIHLPNGVETIDNMRVWGHGQLNGEIEREDERTISFYMSPFITGTYLEVRVAILEPEMFTGATRTSNREVLQTILSEETAWANEANAKRERIKQNEALLFWGTIIVCGIVAVIFVILIIKNLKKIKETPKMEATQKLDYFRDIPDESSTPSEVGFLYYYGKTSLSMIMPRILSSTMLDLALKKQIEFEVHPELSKNEQVIIKMVAGENGEKLKTSEKMIYDLFQTIARGTGTFNMKEFEKYAKRNNTTFLNKLNEIEAVAKVEQEAAGNYDKEIKKKHDNWIAKGTGALAAIIIAAFFALGLLEVNIIALAVAIIPVVIYAMTCFTMGGKFSGLTQKGLDEKEQWEGLRKYMEDFSLIKDREVPELVLWEKYLVYATLFGNAEKVLKQLKVVYPEFSNDDYMRNTTYFYLVAHTDFNHSFVSSVNTAMQRAYQSSIASSSSSSGGGFGGGFSGGGGGRRWRRPVAVDAKNRKTRKNEQN